MKIEFLILIFAAVAVVLQSCSDDPVEPSKTGRVLLAEVAADTAEVTLGSVTISNSVSSSKLDFTDRDSAEISFIYAGSSGNSSVPIKLYFRSGTRDSVVYSGTGLTLNSAEHSVTVTFPSPKVKEYFFYELKVTTGTGYGFFRFREMKIYKK